MPISQYSKVAPLELKEDRSSEILLESLDKKIKKDDIGQAKIQAYADSIASIDILRQDHKEYFDKKYGEAINTINSATNYDFSNPNNIRAMSDQLDSLLYDPVIGNAISSTKRFREVSAELEEAINNPKLKGIWKPYTVEYDRARQQEYINSTDINAVYDQQHMTIYDGYEENTSKALKDIKDRTHQEIGENGTSWEITGKNTQAVLATVDQGISSSSMPKIEFANAIRRDPNFISKIYSSVNSTIEQKQNELEKSKAMLIGQKTDSTFYRQHKAHIDNLENQIEGLKSTISRPQNQDDAYNIFVHNKKENFIKSSGALDRTEVRKLDEVYKFNTQEERLRLKDQYDRDTDLRDYNFDVAKFEHEKSIDLATIALKRDEKFANAEGSDVTGMSALGGSLVNGTNPFIVDAPMEEVKKEEYAVQKFSQPLRESQAKVSASLSRINNLLTEPETRAKISKGLKAKGFTKGIDSFLDIGAISPNNIYKFKAVLDDIFVEGISKNHLVDSISNELRTIAENNKKSIVMQSINKQVLDTTLKSMGLKPGTRMTSLSPEVQKTVFSKAEKLLDEYGLSVVQGKKVIRTNFEKEKGYEGLSNLLKTSFSSSLDFLIDKKGNKIRGDVAFDPAKSSINYVDADGFAYVTLRAPSGDKEGAAELVGKENQYKFKLDKNSFQLLKDKTIGAGSAFGGDITVDDILKTGKIDIPATTGFANISSIANSLDGLPARMAVPYRITSANSQAYHIKLNYNGGDKPLTKNNLSIGSYTTTSFKSIKEFTNTLAQRCRTSLQELNKLESAKKYTNDEKLRIAKDMAIASIVSEASFN